MTNSIFQKTSKGVALIFAALVLISGCGSNNPVDIQKADKISHSTRISQNETWSAHQTHVITNDLIIENATLTIEAGSRIEIKDSTQIRVGSGGAIEAIGTEGDSIIFSVNQPQQVGWKNIQFSKDCAAQSCVLEYCIFSAGGSGDSLSAMIICENVSPSISHCSIQHSRTNGISFSGAATLENFTHNHLTGNKLAPILLPAASVGFLDFTTKFIDNGRDIILITEPGNFTEDQTWRNLELPYELDTQLRISENALTFLPGVTINVTARAAIEIVYDGSLIAEGTYDSMIVFQGTASQPGAWKGIYIKDNKNSRFDYCRFSDGGSEPFVIRQGKPLSANIFCEYATPAFTNCEFTNSAGYGLIFDNESQPSSLSGNLFEFNTGPPIRIQSSALGFLEANRFMQQEGNYIEVAGGNLTEPLTIKNLNIPYRLVKDLNIFYNQCEIKPGVEIQLGAGVSINIAAYGSLKAVGLSLNQPIKFTATLEQVHWSCIYFAPDCNAPDCELNFCTFEYGGGDIRWPANIYIEGCNPEITNCIIRHSRRWGVFLSNSTAEAEIINNDNVFEGNLLGDVGP